MKERRLNVTKYVCMAVLFCALVMITGRKTAFATDGDTFTSGGLNYQVISENDKTVKVTGYTKISANLTIPGTVQNGSVTYSVTVIGLAAFEGNTTIKGLTLSEGITELQVRSFRNCTSLTTVTVPASLTTVGTSYFGEYCSAFTGCTKLTTVNIPAKMTKIPDNLFCGAKGLTAITIPDTITEIGIDVFRECTNLKSVTFGSNIKIIGCGAFNGCTSLTTLTMPASLTEIRECAFVNCSKLSSVTLNGKLNKIASWAFGNCTSLTGITIPKSLRECGSEYFAAGGGWCGPFTGCSKLSDVKFENGITTIPSSIFLKCSGIKTITFPVTVTEIQSHAFSECENLTNIQLSANLTTIRREAFSRCKKLTGVVLPSRLKSITGLAFGGCTSLTEITIPKSLTECIEAYDVNWGGDCGPFADCSNLKTVTFEEGMTTIPDYILLRCNGVTSVVLPKVVTKIGKESFASCTALNSFTIPNTVQEIGTDAFAKSGLTSVTIPSSVTIMGSGILNDATSLKTITISAKVSRIPSFFASGCTALTTVNYPTDYAVDEIGQKAFYGCTSLTTMKLPATVSTLEDNVFTNCTSLTSMALPSQIRTMGVAVFEGCESLKTVTLSAGLLEIPENTFKDCSLLSSADIPYRVTKIGNRAFDNCYSLTNIAIPKSVTEISDTAFSYPGSMTINGISGSYAQTFSNNNEIAFTTKAVATTKITLHVSKLLDPALSSTEMTMETGTAYRVIAALTPVASTQGVVWSSSNTKAVTVDDDGVVRAIAGGKAVISAKSGNASASFTIIVKEPLTGLKLDKSSITFNAVGGYTTLKATKTPTNTSESVVWSSSNTKVATVDANGKVVAKAVGTAVITATGSESKNVKATCNITVKNITLATPSIKVECTGYNKLKISWGKVSNATGYQIYRYNSKTKVFEKMKDITSGSTTSYTNTGLGGYEYKYKVKAVMTSYNKTVYSALSAQKSAKPKPNKVTGLKQSAYTSTSISLKWTKQTGVTGYQIAKCSSANGTYTTVKTLTSNTASYTSNNCKSGTSYYYKVRAYKTNGSGTKVYGAYSAPVKMTTKPAATTVSLKKASSTSVKVTWTKTTGSAYYEVYMATSKNGTYSKVKTVKSGSTLSYTKTGLTKGKTYYFKVRSYKTDAKGAKVYSGWSAIKSKSL